MQELFEKINDLPDDLKKEVSDFVDFISTRKRPSKLKAKLDWIGLLKDYQEKYNSVDLQKHTSEWRKGLVSTGH